jgi:hypothetical protein
MPPQPTRQPKRRRIGQRHFPHYRSTRRRHVVAAEVEQALVGHLPQPQMKRHRSALEIVRQPPERLQVRFLHHVRRVDPGAQPRVGAYFDHLP